MHLDRQKDLKPVPTDLDEKLIALRRRTAAASKPKDKADRMPVPVPTPSRKHQLSPSAHHDADPDDFTRRLKISHSPSRPPSEHAPKQQPSKLFNPDRDPIPIVRRTAEPDPMDDAPSSSYVSRHPTTGPSTGRHLFNPRKDDPVRFAVLARPSNSRPTPTPKSSGDYISASSTSSYAPSQASSAFTLSSSTTDGSSASSALFDKQGKPSEGSGGSVFATQLKKLYRTITNLETKVKQDDLDPEETSRILLKGKQTEDEEIERDQWKKRIADHKQLAENIHHLLEISHAPSVPTSFREIPTKYNMIVRLWTNGFYRLLESLRRASLTSHLALEHLQDFIYYSYTFYTGLLEEPQLRPFRAGWLEALGDLARYRMAVAALVTANQGDSNATTLTAANVSQAEAAAADSEATTSASGERTSVSDEPVARIDNSPSPSVGLVAARLLYVEPEKERWRKIAQDWYGAGLAEQPGTGRLHHHLGLLSREVEEEELRAVYHYVRSMTTLHPLPMSRESVLTMWTGPLQARRASPDASVTELFVLLHGMLFTNIQLDDFQPTMARFLERLELEGAEEREWTMMAVISIGSILEYGKSNGSLRKAGALGKDSTSAAAAKRVLAKRGADDMDVDDVDDGKAIQPSPTLSQMDADSPNHAFTLAQRLAFAILQQVLRHPTRKPSPFSRSVVNPYLTVLLTFLSTLLKHPSVLPLLERNIPWEEMAQFFRRIPRAVMMTQGLGTALTLNDPHYAATVIPPSASNDVDRWPMLTSGCQALPEDWCLRGMEWVGRKVYERGFWKNGEDRRMENDYLESIEAGHGEETDGHIEDDDDGGNNDGESAVTDLNSRRWTRIVRCAVGVANQVDGLTWIEGTREWRIEGVLKAKEDMWREQERQEREEEEQRRMRRRWNDDDMRVDDEPQDELFDESSDEDEDESEDVKALRARRRYLRSLLRSSQTSNGQPSRSKKNRSEREFAPPLTQTPIIPGYTVLVIDTNILLSSLSMFTKLVESQRWTVMIPLPVVTELDGLSSETSQLGEAAQQALSYLSAHIRSHSLCLKVQTSKGNYLTSLNVRTENFAFSTSGSIAERSMDDLILKAAIWHEEHWVDRSSLLKVDTMRMEVTNAAKVVLLSFDRNLRLKARARQLAVATEKDLAAILAADES